MKKIKFLLIVLSILVMVPGVFRIANAAKITIEDIGSWTLEQLEQLDPPCIQSGDDNSQSQINYILAGLTELYKSDVGDDDPYTPVETGSLAESYATIFDPPSDPEDALITYTGGAWVGGQAYLLVKDGAQDPSWYLINLTRLGWDGQTAINLEGFWPDQGAISHVALYGIETSVPIPAAAWLLGSGLLGLVGVQRWRRRG